MKVDELPAELLVHILAHTHPADTFNFALTNKSLNGISFIDNLWKYFCKYLFPVDQSDYILPPSVLWIECFKFFHMQSFFWKPKVKKVTLLDNGYTVRCDETTDFPRFKVVLGNTPLSPSRNSFEVKITSCTKIESELVNYITYGSGEAQIGIGIATAEANLTRFLGSDVSIARAFYNDGMVGHGGTTVSFGDTYHDGDTIGIKLHFDTYMIEVSRNGKPLMQHLHNLSTNTHPIFPAICLRSQGDSVLMKLPPFPSP